MRALAFVAVLVSCSCGAAPDAAPLGDESPAADQPGCVTISDEARGAFPTIETAVSDAAARWGKTIEFGAACGYVIALDDIEALDSTTLPVGESRTDGMFLQRSAVGVSLADTSQDECDAAWDAGAKPWKLLSRVLVHELGHALLLPHSPEQHDAMFDFSGYCYDPGPSEAELAAASGREFFWRK